MRKYSLTMIGGIATAAALAAAGVAYSQTAERRGIDTNGDGNVTRAEATAAAQARFARTDANNDGRLTVADREAGRERRSAEMFARIDADSNGSITRAEWDAHGAQMRERMMQLREARNADGERRGHGMRAMHRGEGRGDDRRMRMLRSADSNGDQAIDQAEFTAAAIRRFEAMDANRDGTVTAAERTAYRAQMRERIREEVRTRRVVRQPGEGEAPAAPAE